MKLPFREQSASIILLPDGKWGEDLLDLVESWSKNWLLQPAYWLSVSNIKHFEGRPPEVLANVIGRNGRREVDLFQQLSRYSIPILRLISIRLVEESTKRSETQDTLVDVLAKYIENSKPLTQRVGQNKEIGSQLIKVNLIFSPSEVTGASYPHLHEPLWNFNIVVAPEDRTFPTGFDSFISSNNKEKLTGFILSNTATAAGIWTGQTTSAYEEELKHSQNSVQYDKVLVQRSFTRAIVSDALAFRVAAHALDKLLNYNEETISEIQRNNQSLKILESKDESKAIDELVNKVMQLNNNELDYLSPESLKNPDKKMISLKNRIVLFIRFVSGIFMKLPIWIFTGLFKGLTKFVSRKIDSEDGEYEISTEIDFPQTKLDGIVEAEVVQLQQNLITGQLAVDEWPRATLRKAPPHLFADIRGMLFNSLDNTTYKDPAKEIFANASKVIPDFRETWDFKKIENFEEFSDLIKNDDEDSTKFSEDLSWLNSQRIKETKAELDVLINNLTQEFVMGSTEVEELSSESEIINKKIEDNRLRIKFLQKSSVSGEVLNEKK